MRIAAGLFLVALAGLSHKVSAGGDGPQEPPTAQRDGNTVVETRVATVFGQPLTLAQVTPVEAEVKRKELSRDEFDRWLWASRGRRTYEKLWSAVLQRYVAHHKIEVSEAELAEIARSVDAELKSHSVDPVASTITPLERKAIRVAWARASLMDWKVCKSLHEKYGGRVGLGSLGAWVAFDGQNSLLREHIKLGDITFEHAEIENAFWQHTRIDNFADSYPQGDRLKELLARPPTLRQ